MSKDEQATKRLKEMSSDEGPGIQYVVVNRAGVLYEHSLGLADVKNKTAMSLIHTMAAFSMTKTLTAIAILQLAERGELEIDAPVSRYAAHPYSQSITIRQLLSHTSGVPNPIPLRWVHLATEHAGFNEKAALASILAVYSKPISRPGGRYFYSNINYWLLGDIIESVSGKNYSDYIRANVFHRLGLSPTEIDFTYSETAPHAKGYLAKFSFMNLLKGFITDKAVWGQYEGKWLHIKDVYVNGPAFGGAIGAARAFSVILRDLMSDRSDLLNENGRELLFTRQRTMDGKEIDMTLGWHIGRLGDVQYDFKEGGGAGFHSEMRMYPTCGLATVIMTNQTRFNTRRGLNTLDGIFLKH